MGLVQQIRSTQFYIYPIEPFARPSVYFNYFKGPFALIKNSPATKRIKIQFSSLTQLAAFRLGCYSPYIEINFIALTIICEGTEVEMQEAIENYEVKVLEINEQPIEKV
jgi:hypothetical protein